MTVAQVEKVADGRLWSGRDALKNGLVDKLGGYHDAIATAKELAKLPQVTHRCRQAVGVQASC